jgi:hypothetical protein
MAISPNDDFTAGQVLTATECNQFPRGVMALATSTTNYMLTTTSTVNATGMTVTFTAVVRQSNQGLLLQFQLSNRLIQSVLLVLFRALLVQ